VTGRVRAGGERGVGTTAYGGRRSSVQRDALALAADALPGAFTVEELADAAARGGARPALATAYRAVHAMADAGFLEAVGERDGRALFARCAVGGHHHHMVCTACGAIAEAACPVGSAALDEAARAGFVVTRHEVAIYGLCGACSPGPGRT
jgi:Fur family ferric uptake transcriptional regulator